MRHLFPAFGRGVKIAHRWGRRSATGALKLGLAAALMLTGSVLVRSAVSKEIARDRAYDLVEAASKGFSDHALLEMMAGARPDVFRIAALHDPDAPQKSWGRPPGWARLDIETPPSLDLGTLSMSEARKINAVIPNSDVANPPASPFVLKTSPVERKAAIDCLTAAVYYEAALEPREGQEAVAQVVLNRLRHPGYPKSVCGVVFQGADRPGCQFSFACDGSMSRPPADWAWRNATDVAEKALDGYVMKAVGTATHYHTDWIMAPWTPTLVKVGRFGTQIFFRPTGTDGELSAFNAPYIGGELRASRVDLIGKAAPARSPTLILASAPGSVVAPRSVVNGGQLVVMPPSTVFMNRVHGRIVIIGGHPGAISQPPMHAMIAMRADAARRLMQEQDRVAKTQALAEAARVAAPAPPAAATPAKADSKAAADAAAAGADG